MQYSNRWRSFKLNILVVGGAGNLGRGIRINFEHLNHKSVVWDKAEGIHKLTKSVLKENDVDLILNLAVVVDLTKKEVKIGSPDYLVNVIGLSHLVELSEDTEIPLVHISTREVIGVRDFRLDSHGEDSGPKLREIDETEPCFPLHSYGKTKLIGEFIMQGCSRGSTIRLNTCYTNEITNGAGLIANLVRKSRNDSVITLDNKGCALRDPLHVDDLTSLILRIFHTQSFREIFHAGGGSENVYSLKEICRLANSEVQIQFGKDSDDYGFVMDISKAKSLGWSPSINFKDWISDTI